MSTRPGSRFRQLGERSTAATISPVWTTCVPDPAKYPGWLRKWSRNRTLKWTDLKIIEMIKDLLGTEKSHIYCNSIVGTYTMWTEEVYKWEFNHRSRSLDEEFDGYPFLVKKDEGSVVYDCEMILRLFLITLYSIKNFGHFYWSFYFNFQNDIRVLYFVFGFTN